MARAYANVATAIWRDDEFRPLTLAAQHAYLLLMSQPDISAAGVLSLNLTRWASRTKDVTRASLRAALDELEAHRFVVVDEETEELLVRSFVRWDGGYNNPKRRPVIRDAAAEIESHALRRALAAEFERLELPPDWIPAFSQVDSLYPESEIGIPETADTVSASERVVVTKALVAEPQPPTRNKQPASRVPAASGGPREDARKRGTRIPDDFAKTGITPEMVGWARENAPNVNGSYETSKFVDYWRAKPGKDGVKLDWPSTWRNWMRKAQERAGPRGQRSVTDQRVADALDLGAQLQAEADRKALAP